VYFQAFTSLSTGLERIGKLCLMLDHYIDHNRQFPDSTYMKNQIGHNIAMIYQQSKTIIAKYSISMNFLQHLDDPSPSSHSLSSLGVRAGRPLLKYRSAGGRKAPE